MEIIVDDRERAVSPFFEDLSNSHHINYSIKRLEVGDYAICYKGFIMIIIERKTWEDLAASFRDGRKENIQKLLELRERVGCNVVYLIEGDPLPRSDKKYGHIPVKYLRTHLDHIAFRDGIHMIYSKGPQTSAARIFELAQNYSTIKPSPFTEVDDILKEGGDSNKDQLTDKSINEVKEISIQEQLLRCLPSIGSIISALLSENNITLLGLYHKKYLPETIATLKFPSGACIGLDRANKIIKSAASLGSSPKIQLRILSTIPGISTTTATKIIEEISLSDLLSGTVDKETLARINRGKTNIGMRLATSIFEHLGIN